MPRLYYTCAFAALAFVPQISMAQETEADPAGTAQAESEDAPAIIVTGSRIRGAELAGEVITLDRQAIILAGQIDLGEAIRSLPQNFGGGQNPGVGLGAGLVNSNVNSTSSANLRGLGPDATLTLLNSHRLPYDSAFGGVDISAIPLAALDRIEVVPDGASALYGSDAVAGVVNVILRRDFEGVTTSGQIGASTDGGYFRKQADIVGGTRWKGGGFLLAYDFADNSEIEASQRSFTASLDPDASLYPSVRRHAVTLSGHHDLGGGLIAKVDALYSKRNSRTISETPTIGFVFAPEAETYTVAPSLELELGSDWSARIVGVFGRDRTRYSTTVTPLAGTTRVTSGCYCNSVTAVEAGAEGPLFSLPGGTARLALGGGYRSNGMEYSRLVNGTAAERFDVARRSHYAYGEINLPFVSPGNDMKGIDRLSLSGALRYEDYPGLDRLATPRIGIIYAPVSELSLRASWAQSFKAPSLFQQYRAYEAYLLPAAAFGAGTGASTVFYTSGGNPGLKPETARSWTAGFEYRPEFISGLTLSATWFDIRYRDRVVQPIAGSIAAAFQDPGYATLIDRAPTAPTLAALVSGAQLGLQNFTGSAFNPANVVALIDNRDINVGVQEIRGIDGRLSWNGELGDGRLGADVSASWLESSQQLTADLPAVQLAGTIFSPPKFRLRASVNYQTGGLTLSSAINYTGALADRRFAAAARVSPGATMDIGASYDVIGGEGRDPGLSISLTINNLLNDKPEIIRTTGPTDTPYDSTNYSPIGRFIALGIRRHW